ncbi:hypothetical protein GCM10009765_68830 [Fodinicola feengrottensis]|uniref:Putative sensor domain-containing protein n=2 Tax=Fodinicola feengrottensis TaxID=435914 RepID=A0ABN2IR87_9ACTN
MQKRPFPRQVGTDTAYSLGGFVVAVIRFVLLVTLFSVGLGTLVIGIGFPILVLALYVARRFADIERHWVGAVRGRPSVRPAYRSLEDRSGLKRLLTPLAEAQSWRDFLYGVFAFIPATIAFVLAVTWWVAGVGGTLYFLWGWSLPTDGHTLAYLLGLGSSYRADLILETTIGVLFLLTAPLMSRLLAVTNTAISRSMLTTDWIG